MILTTKSRYAVMAIIELASSQNDQPVNLATISAKQNISINYLEQIFAKLRRAGVVVSIKGPGGGYKLASKPEEVSIETIIQAMEENLKMTRCSYDKNCAKNGVRCKTHNLWKGMSLAIKDYLSKISVADVVQERFLL